MGLVKNGKVKVHAVVQSMIYNIVDFLEISQYAWMYLVFLVAIIIFTYFVQLHRPQYNQP